MVYSVLKKIIYGCGMLLASSSTVWAVIPPTEQLALEKLFSSTNGPNWQNNTGWLIANDTCTWYGVTCNVDSTHVVEINLFANQLNGQIPSEIGYLTELKILALHSNDLYGNIPIQLAKLTKLEKLYLADNSLNGLIPAKLGDIGTLQELFLYRNILIGSIPVELGKMQNLQVLLLNNNQLSGGIPPELGNLEELYQLDLSFNQLTGETPPELGKLINLKGLYLYNNQLSGTIPNEFGNLKNVVELGLSKNQLTGQIPAGLGQMTNLKYLQLNENQLFGEIPAELGQLANLKQIVMESNRLYGPVPPSLANKPLTEFRHHWNALYYAKDTIINSKISQADLNSQTLAPTDVLATEIGSNFVRLEWTARDTDPSTPGGYQVFMSKNGELYELQTELLDKNTNASTINNLEPDTDYWFRVESVTLAHNIMIPGLSIPGNVNKVVSYGSSEGDNIAMVHTAIDPHNESTGSTTGDSGSDTGSMTEGGDSSIDTDSEETNGESTTAVDGETDSEGVNTVTGGIDSGGIGEDDGCGCASHSPTSLSSVALLVLFFAPLRRKKTSQV